MTTLGYVKIGRILGTLDKHIHDVDEIPKNTPDFILLKWIKDELYEFVYGEMKAMDKLQDVYLSTDKKEGS